MNDINEVVVELEAVAGFVHEHVTNKADSLSLEELVAAEDALRKMAQSIKDAQTLITTAQCNQLEAGARQIGTRVFVRVPKFRETYEHSIVKTAIRQRAKDQSLNKASGEIDLNAAVDAAVELTARTYTSPSTKPKVGMVDELGLDRKAVVKRERTGYEVSVTETEPDDDE